MLHVRNTEEFYNNSKSVIDNWKDNSISVLNSQTCF